MLKIYEQFEAATKPVSAYVVMEGGECIGRVVFKYPRDGIGRLYAYVQIWGLTMVRGWAAGCGYDKHTAAVEAAVARLTGDEDRPDAAAHLQRWKEAMSTRDGDRWDRRLQSKNYSVWGVI